MLSNSQVVDLARALESHLQAQDGDLTDFLPLIRMHLYFAQRPAAHMASPAAGAGRLRMLVDVVTGVGRMLQARLVGIRCRQVFVAPATHRNVPRGGALESKHLDSLVERYARDGDAIWELRPVPPGVTVDRSLPCAVLAVARLLARLRGPSRRVRALRDQLDAYAQACEPELNWDLPRLELSLATFETARGIFYWLFRRSDIRRAFFVCYYGAAQFPLLAALNDLGRETVEYQHGIQSDVQPMYSGWEHLQRKPASMPDRVLLWDGVALRRISRWADALGIETEEVGNLWFAAMFKEAPPHSSSRSILVALQLYPSHFNENILDAMQQSLDLEWVFREHPYAVLSAEQRDALLERNPRLRIISPTDEPLEASLARCTVCITGFSTVGLEAVYCGRRAIFTHENAREGLADYIDDERCFYAAEAADILRLVRGEG
ncbi:MAG: hypothetical protein R3228_15480 [Halioglobus sp.]|nr:hypothetical protein [Halioglobus sp.]